MEIPKFPPGDGSRIKIEFPQMDGTTAESMKFQLKTYFVYDQGSNSQNVVFSFATMLGIILGVEIPAIFIFGSYYHSRKSTMKMVKELLQIRYRLVNSIQNNNLSKINLKPIITKYYKRTALANHSLIQEYTTMLDFEQLLEERNNMQGVNYQFKNKSCLSKLDSILNQTNWSAHYEIQTIFRIMFFRIRYK